MNFDITSCYMVLVLTDIKPKANSGITSNTKEDHATFKILSGTNEVIQWKVGIQLMPTSYEVRARTFIIAG